MSSGRSGLFQPALRLGPIACGFSWVPGASTIVIGITQFDSGFLAKERAKRDEEKKQIVSGLQHVKSLEALDMLGKYMDDPALKAEAQMSAANLIWDLRGSHPTEVRAIAKRLVESKNKNVADKARKTITDLDKSKR